MSQQGRSRGDATPEPNIIPGVISAVVVLIILGVLGIFLANRSVEQSAASPPAVASPLAANPAATTAPEPAARQTYSAAPPMTIDPAKTYTATIATPRGDIVVQLRPDVAPQTVNNFVFLAREGFYNGLTWHRVLPNFMAQGGDPTGTGMGGPGYSVPAEFNSIRFDRPGILAMARSADPNSAGSQFFITTAPAEWLNDQYTAFGEVIEGQEIVNSIPLRDPDQNPTGPGEQMLSITITEE